MIRLIFLLANRSHSPDLIKIAIVSVYSSNFEFKATKIDGFFDSFNGCLGR